MSATSSPSSTITSTATPTPIPVTYDDTQDIIAGSIYAVIFVLYNAGLYWATRLDPGRTVTGVAHVARATWATSILNESGSATLVAQTLRNIIQSVQNLSSAILSVAFGVFTYVVSNVVVGTSSSTNPYRPNFYDNFRGWKIALVLCMVVVSFLFFAQCTRYLSHFPFIMQSHAFLQKSREKNNLPAQTWEQWQSGADFAQDVDAEYLSWVLNRGMMYYTLAFRVFYFSIPIFLWFFGLWWFVGSAIIIVLVLVLLDSAGISGIGGREGDEEGDEEVVEQKKEIVRRLSVWQGAVSTASGLDMLPPETAAEVKQRARSNSMTSPEKFANIGAPSVNSMLLPSPVLSPVSGNGAASISSVQMTPGAIEMKQL